MWGQDICLLTNKMPCDNTQTLVYCTSKLNQK